MSLPICFERLRPVLMLSSHICLGKLYLSPLVPDGEQRGLRVLMSLCEYVVHFRPLTPVGKTTHPMLPIFASASMRWTGLQSASRSKCMNVTYILLVPSERGVDLIIRPPVQYVIMCIRTPGTSACQRNGLSDPNSSFDSIFRNSLNLPILTRKSSSLKTPRYT
jgi:hypothetical protein